MKTKFYKKPIISLFGIFDEDPQATTVVPTIVVTAYSQYDASYKYARSGYKNVGDVYVRAIMSLPEQSNLHP